MSSQMIADLYKAHITQLLSVYTRGLEALTKGGIGADGILLHSGIEQHYYGDDRGISFQAYGHFLHWLSANRPDQFLLIRPEEQPSYIQIVPPDYWYEQDIQDDPLWHDNFEIHRLASVDQLSDVLPHGRFVYCGASTERATVLGLDQSRINPKMLLHFLDYHRACKTNYELVQLREANRLAMVGHQAARECFLAGGSEYDIHLNYLSACKILEDETPYTNIVALDEKSAILHYQYKRRIPGNDSQLLLIDAGYRVRGYGSDITRTSLKETGHPTLRALRDGMDSIEQALVAEVRPGKSYVEIHLSALSRLGELLVSLDICRGSLGGLIEQQIPQLFMPHGVGHLLGIQVHDCGGHLQNEQGDLLAPPDHSPMLRNTREMMENMVLTIEPGCYFIPLLLEPERNSDRGKLINWSLVEELIPLGGVRIEDNVCVLASGVENLTRAPIV
ncbi:MAG: Xaa-Pro dipeptidase [Gammaproteobacteria bacterium]|nr:Xaa-Pro dipeptidase [Gammaproteobacteria bacterium]